MKTNRLFPIVAVSALIAGLALTGCATSYNPNVYQTGLTEQNVQIGTVLAVRYVRIQPANAGGAVGTVGGALIGSRLGGDSGNPIIHGVGALAGAVIGGLAGQAAGNSMTTQPGEVVTVRFDDGQTIAVTQTLTAADQLHQGERVQLLQSSAGKTRVLPL